MTITDLGLRQRESGPVGPDTPDCRGLYIHVPFCFHKCHYCDFYSIVDSRDRQDQFVHRLCDELEATARWWSGPLESIFVGGGTPTLLSADAWTHILNVLDPLVCPAAGMEFTVEANPETIDEPLLAALRAGGVNRLSIGAQSFDTAHLVTLERHHDPANVRRGFALARAAGIDNVNLDLIFAIPGQTLEQWIADLDAALELAPRHISCYALMYEPNTPLTQRMRTGAVQRADEDLEAAIYEVTIDRLAAAGYEHYEISNWARPGFRCRHNELYWLNRQWWPIGPSASGHAAGRRWKNAPHLGRYLDSKTLPPIEGVEHLDDDGRVGEELMLGLRRLDGVDDARLEALLAQGDRGAERRTSIERRIKEGLLERRGGAVALTRRGVMLADMIVGELL